MIVDSHLHVLFSKQQPWKPLVEQLLRHMEIARIQQACLMPHPQFSGRIYPSPDEMKAQAETLAEIALAHPGRFYPMLFICPMLPFDFTSGLMSDYIVNGPLIGAKFHISLYADDERHRPIYDFLETHDIPVLYHAWYKTVERTTFESTPAQIANVARNHPKLRILMAHLTGGKLRGIQDIRNYPNVWIDTSGAQPEDGYLGQALETLGADRILYGSDYPFRSFATQLARIDSIPMSASERENMLYRNAQRFFRKGGSQ